jgi:type I restriction enzyme S subunit
MSFPRYPSYKDSGVEWLGEVPEDWSLPALYTIARERDESNKGMLETNLLSLSFGRIIKKDINSSDGLLPESFETYQITRKGDIVFRLTDLQNDKRSLRTAIVEDEVGIITSAYAIVCPLGISAYFLNYLLRAYDITKVFYSMGGGLRQSLKFSDIRRLPVLCPAVEVQNLIAAFLDRETAKIDALVAEQENLIALLKEKRQAVISHAVTKGLDPTVPMKDSGIEWLGEVPAYWDVKRLGYLCSDIKAGPFGSSLTKDMYVGEGYRIYGQEQVIPNDFTIGDYYISQDTYSRLQQYEVQQGDILISCVGTFGRIATVPDGIEPGIINPRLMRLRVNPGALPFPVEISLA